MIAGTGSGCGKTTVTCALMKALKDRAISVAPFKCGPDYIDPMFHRQITDRASVNLDLFFTKPQMLRWLLNGHLQDDDVAVIEGAMGMYDGIGATTQASAYEVASVTKTPVILVVNARGMSASVGAMISGYKNYGEDHTLVQGVILNHISRKMYLYLKDAIESGCGVKVLGYMTEEKEISLESRHLGLVTAAEVENLNQKIEKLGKIAEETIDIDAVLEIAQAAEPIVMERMPWEMAMAGVAAGTKVNLAVAMDKAFCFYYEDNLKLFESLGVTILPFSPLAGEQVPKEAHGIYLGGGYPELYLEELEKQVWVKFSIRNCWSKKMPMIAECGGFMYLHEMIENRDGQAFRMVGILPGKAKMTEKMGPFGYIDVHMPENSIFGESPAVIKGHEFHYSVSEAAGSDLTAVKPDGRQWQTGFANDFMYAGYPHLYFYSDIDSAIQFKKAMVAYKKANPNGTSL